METEEQAHSLIGPSTMHRWENCPGSRHLIPKAPPQPAGKYAHKGTLAHILFEAAMNGQNEDDYDDVAAQLTQGDREAIADALEFVVYRYDLKLCDIYTETRIELPKVHKDLFGTCDLIVYNPYTKSLAVLDYKHGAGVPVDAEGNSQLLYYLAGAIEFLSGKMKEKLYIDEMEVGILQPRANHEGGEFRIWKVEPEVLAEFSARLARAAVATDDPNAPLKSGPWCRWCSAKMICPAWGNRRDEMIRQDFGPISAPENLHLPAPKEMTVEEAAKILSFKPVFDAWFKEVNQYLYDSAMKGEKVDGFKLVRGITHRRWKGNEENVRVELDNHFDRIIDIFKLKSPSQIEEAIKELGKKTSFQDKLIEESFNKIKELSEKPEPGTTLVPNTDRRKEVEPNNFERIELS